MSLILIWSHPVSSNFNLSHTTLLDVIRCHPHSSNLIHFHLISSNNISPHPVSLSGLADAAPADVLLDCLGEVWELHRPFLQKSAVLSKLLKAADFEEERRSVWDETSFRQKFESFPCFLKLSTLLFSMDFVVNRDGTLCMWSLPWGVSNHNLTKKDKKERK